MIFMNFLFFEENVEKYLLLNVITYKKLNNEHIVC